MNTSRETHEYSDDKPPPDTLPGALPATRDADGADDKPPMISPARGPMDQQTPDVPTGSTPLTRHDD